MARAAVQNGGAHAALAIERAPGASDMAVRQDRVDQLVRAFRVRGHMIAKVDPLGLPRPHYEELDPDVFGEELEQPGYELVERIAAVGLKVVKA